jgi:hypothetical protein
MSPTWRRRRDPIEVTARTARYGHITLYLPDGSHHGQGLGEPVRCYLRATADSDLTSPDPVTVSTRPRGPRSSGPERGKSRTSRRTSERHEARG